MQSKNPVLFIELNNSNYIFAAGEYDNKKNIKILEKIIVSSEGLNKNKLTDIDQASALIIKNIQRIEKKLNYIFKEVTLIIDSFEYSCINISGFKKLNGSQVLKENISYILNSLKLAITKNLKKEIIHIFNSRSILDGVIIDRLPIGLFGDFYTHELTFFLIGSNDYKNIIQILNKSNLSLKKIFLKSFSEGVYLIKKNKNIKTFFQIKINKEDSKIIFFDESSFRYSQQFNFGTSLILNDISKVCSLEKEIIENFLSDYSFTDKNIDKNVFLEKKYFLKGNYRKIRKQLIIDIVNARIEEIVNIVFNNNINIESFKKNNFKIYLIIKDKLISKCFKTNFILYVSENNRFQTNLLEDFEIGSSIISTANLSIQGWKNEAIPVIQNKETIIGRIFNALFG
jgi:cell division protein FtsA